MAEASAVASSANLGPGFDTLAVALEIRCRVIASPANGWSIEHGGTEGLPTGHRDLVLVAAQRASKQALALVVDNEIPIARGLGSSSASAAAGAAAAMKETAGAVDLNRVLAIVGELDGHWDNGAAAVYGGLQAVTAAGASQRLAWHESLHVVLAVPDESIPTEVARSALPEGFAIDAVTRTLARLGALVEGLRTADAELLAGARGDEIHESARVPLYADAGALIEGALAAGALHCYLSGAGSTVGAIVTDETRDGVTSTMEQILGARGRVLAARIASEGVR